MRRHGLVLRRIQTMPAASVYSFFSPAVDGHGFVLNALWRSQRLTTGRWCLGLFVCLVRDVRTPGQHCYSPEVDWECSRVLVYLYATMESTCLVFSSSELAIRGQTPCSVPSYSATLPQKFLSKLEMHKLTLEARMRPAHRITVDSEISLNTPSYTYTRCPPATDGHTSFGVH